MKREAGYSRARTSGAFERMSSPCQFIVDRMKEVWDLLALRIRRIQGYELAVRNYFYRTFYIILRAFGAS